VLVVTALLTAFSGGYPLDRDEPYLAMLQPAWVYVDQPPVTSLLAHGLASLYDGGEPVAVRTAPRLTWPKLRDRLHHLD
jgi:hypothetical protein